MPSWAPPCERRLLRWTQIIHGLEALVRAKLGHRPKGHLDRASHRIGSSPVIARRPFSAFTRVFDALWGRRSNPEFDAPALDCFASLATTNQPDRTPPYAPSAPRTRSGANGSSRSRTPASAATALPTAPPTSATPS